MFTQFFGNYLLNNGYITSSQLVNALSAQQDRYVKLGFLAIHSGYMTSRQVEEVHITQTHTNKKFGEIAVDKGYLTNDQVSELLESQKPDYLIFSQTLDNLGYLDTATFEKAFNSYREEHHLSIEDFTKSGNDKIINLLHSKFRFFEEFGSDFPAKFLSLLYNNITRFIGKDFTPQPVKLLENFPSGHCTRQNITGASPTAFFYVSDSETLIKFASRYAQEEFENIDEYVTASVEDFINLHNGLFITTMSNEYSIELFLDPSTTEKSYEAKCDMTYYEIPVIFSFGQVNFVIEKQKEEQQ